MTTVTQKKDAKSKAPASTKAPAEKKPPAKAAPVNGATTPPAAAAAVDPKLQAKANALVDFGKVVEVPFGLLRIDDNIRGILDKDDQNSLDESVKEGKAQERLVVHQRPDGTYAVESGSRRYRSLKKANYPAEAMIEVVLRPPPATRAEDRLRGLKASISSEIAWPDKARAIGEIVGVRDEKGALRTAAALKQAREKGLVKSHKEAAAEIGYSSITVDQYARIAHAEYKDLVKIYEAGGSAVHGEVFAKYPDEKQPEILKYYLSHHASFPVDEPPPRQKAPGGGRKPIGEAAIPRRGKAAGIPGRKQKPGPDKKGAPPAVWDGGKTPLGALPQAQQSILSAKGDAAPAPPAQTTMFTELPANGTKVTELVAGTSQEQTPVLTPPARQPYQRPAEEEVEICDHYGIPLEAVRLLDRTIQYWSHQPLADWLEGNAEGMRRAFVDYGIPQRESESGRAD